MRQLNKISVVLLGIAVLFILYLLECKRTLGLADDEMAIKKSVWAEMEALISQPPTVIHHHDTIIIEKPIYIHTKVPIPVAIPSETKDSTYYYSDSIINEGIRYWEKIWSEGVIIALERRYEPIIHLREITTEKMVPQIVNVEVPVYKRELYLSGVIGGHMTGFSYGLDLDFVNLKRNIYGFQYRRVVNENFYYFKIGTKILPR